MGDSLLARPIDSMHRRLDDRNPTPNRKNQNFHLKLVSPCPRPKAQRFSKGINAKSGLRIGKPSPARCPDPEVGESSAPATGPRYIPISHPYPLPYHQGPLPFGHSADQRRNIFRIVLSVGINRDRPVRERKSRLKPRKQRSSLSLILLVAHHCDTGKGSKDTGSGICRSIIHYNHGQPEPKTFFNDRSHPCPMVISGNDNDAPKRRIHTIYQLPPPPPPKPPPEKPPPPPPPLPLGAENIADPRLDVIELKE